MSTVFLKGIKEALKQYDKAVVMKATRRSLTRVAGSARTEGSKRIRRERVIKKSDLDPKVRINRKDLSKLTVTIESQDKPLPVILFNARQTLGSRVITRTRGYRRLRVSKNDRQGVTFEIMRGRVTHKPHAFIQVMRSGHIGVFERIPGKRMRNKSKQAVMELRHITVPSLILGKKVIDPMIARISEQWPKEFEHNLEWYLSQEGVK